MFVLILANMHLNNYILCLGQENIPKDGEGHTNRTN